jgi:hypothetical protein
MAPHLPLPMRSCAHTGLHHRQADQCANARRGMVRRAQSGGVGVAAVGAAVRGARQAALTNQSRARATGLRVRLADRAHSDEAAGARNTRKVSRP